MHTYTTAFRSIALLLLLTLVTPFGAFANHNDGNDYSWWGNVSSSLGRKINNLDNDVVDELKIPILLGVTVANLDDTWGDARSNGRTHEGIDIFAPRGAFIVSPTEAVVTQVGDGNLGGNVVYTANPGGETFYYAHLDGYAEDLSVGDELDAGDLIGYVGNSGNASAASPHLHFTIYGDDGAENPYPRLTEVFDTEERIESIEKILDDADSDDEEDIAKDLVLKYRSLFTEAIADDIDIPEAVEDALGQNTTIAVSPVAGAPLSRTLRQGMTGADVVTLQAFLIMQNKGVSSRALGNVGATGNFGPLTHSAVVEFQKSTTLTADGIVGPKTQAYILGATS